jgi:preprotein translocase subunit SecG
MHTAVIIIHIVACLALILIVLLQTGRGAEMGAAFGGASQTLFGGTGGATFLGKLTTAAAVVFMLTCLGLSYFAAGPQTKSIMENVPAQKPEGPALPEAKPIEPVTGQAPTAAEQPKPEESKATEPALPKLPEPAKEAQPPAPAAQEKAPASQGKPPAAPKP